MRRSGKINLTTIAMILGGLAALYWAIFFIPVYVDHMYVKDAVMSAFNSCKADTNSKVRHTLVAALQGASFGKHKEIDNYGTEVDVEGLEATEENPLLEYDENENTFHVRYTYDRVIDLLPTQKKYVLHFTAERKGKCAR